MSIDFIEQMQNDINSAVEKADVFKETSVVQFKPVFTEKVTPESLKEHVDFINKNTAIVEAGTSQIAYDNYSETKSKVWEGNMDLGPVTISSRAILNELIGETPQFGITHTLVDHIHSPELTGWHKHFNEMNQERCKNLFETPIESADEN